MARTRQSLFLFAVFLGWVGVAVLLLWPEGGDDAGGVEGGSEADRQVVVGDDRDVPRPVATPRTGRGGLPASPLDQLGAAGGSAEGDVRVLAMLFDDYRSVFKRMPLGTHEEIVGALRGENPRGIAYIPEGHPAVNGDGVIADRWGRAYFFHVISRSAMEIISAGPDGELFTDDDVRFVPPGAAVEPAIEVVAELAGE